MKRLFLTLLLGTMPTLAHAAARVSSDSACPSAGAISQRLLGFLTAGGPEAASAHVRVDGEDMHIELVTPGEEKRERVVSLSGDCEQRADMAALIIAAWLDALPVGTVKAPSLPPSPPAPTPPPPLPPATEPHLAKTSSSSTPGTRTLLSADIFGMADAQGATAGLGIEAAMPNLLGDFGWAAEASIALPREMTVGQGTARYYRPTLALAATGEIHLGSWMLRPRAGAALGILSVKGSSYETNNSSTTVTWGGGGGLALAHAWQRGEIWIRLDALAWPQGRAVRSRQVPSGKDIEVALPAWEARLFVGASWGVH
jgi:hypothetical protein